MKRVLHSNAKVVTAAIGLAVATSKTGDIIDRDAFRDAIVHVNVGNVTGTPTATAVEVAIQHSDTDVAGDFVAAEVQGVPTVLTAAEGQSELHVNLDGFKRYIRVVATASFTGGTSPKADIVSTVVLGNPENAPTI